jgi:hypothetical protein
MILTYQCYKKHVKPLDCMTQNGIGAEFQNENETEREREPETERERER